jgi:hypothetical protein
LSLRADVDAILAESKRNVDLAIDVPLALLSLSLVTTTQRRPTPAEEAAATHVEDYFLANEAGITNDSFLLIKRLVPVAPAEASSSLEHRQAVHRQAVHRQAVLNPEEEDGVGEKPPVAVRARRPTTKEPRPLIPTSTCKKCGNLHWIKGEHASPCAVPGVDGRDAARGHSIRIRSEPRPDMPNRACHKCLAFHWVKGSGATPCIAAFLDGMANDGVPE